MTLTHRGAVPKRERGLRFCWETAELLEEIALSLWEGGTAPQWVRVVNSYVGQDTSLMEAIGLGRGRSPALPQLFRSRLPNVSFV